MIVGQDIKNILIVLKGIVVLNTLIVKKFAQ